MLKEFKNTNLHIRISYDKLGISGISWLFKNWHEYWKAFFSPSILLNQKEEKQLAQKHPQRLKRWTWTKSICRHGIWFVHLTLIHHYVISGLFFYTYHCLLFVWTGVCISFCVPDEFLLKSVVFKFISKEHEYMNIHHPPPPPPN